MDCEILYQGKKHTNKEFAKLLYDGLLEELAPQMDKGYFVINEGYNPFGKKQKFKSSPKIETDKNENIILKRLRPEEEQGRNRSGQTNAEATIILAGVHRATRENYGENSKEYYGIKKSEEKYLEDYAKKNGIWYKNTDKDLGTFLKSGQEQKVYIQPENTSVVLKANNLALHENWLEFLDRIALHNANFPSTNYKLKGFGRDGMGDFVAVLEQPYIQAEELLSHQEVVDYMMARGFSPLRDMNEDLRGATNEYWEFINKNSGVIVGDLHLNNVRKDDKGNIFVIDPVIELDTEDKGYEGDRTTELPDMEFSEDVEVAPKKVTLSQAKNNLIKAWNNLGSQGIIYDPIKNDRDFIDFVKALFDYVKVYGRDKAIPEMVNYVKSKIGIGDKGNLKKQASDAIENFADQLLKKYDGLTQKEVDAVVTAYSEQVGKGAFEKNLDTLTRFGKMSKEKAQQLKDLYQQISDIRISGEEQKAQTQKQQYENPIEILARSVGENADGEMLTRITAMTTDANQQRTPDELQKDALYVEESLARLRNIAFEDASMISLYYDNAPDWVSQFLSELEKDKTSKKAFKVPNARVVGILNVMNNLVYENIIKSTDPLEREELLKVRKRLDTFTNDFMRDISLALGARRSDAVLSEFARGGVLSNYATSRILTKAQIQQVQEIQKALTSTPTKAELNDVNIPSSTPPKTSKPKDSQKKTSSKVKDINFESKMKEKAKGIDLEQREQKAKDLRDRLFNAINKCK